MRVLIEIGKPRHNVYGKEKETSFREELLEMITREVIKEFFLLDYDDYADCNVLPMLTFGYVGKMAVKCGNVIKMYKVVDGQLKELNTVNHILAHEAFSAFSNRPYLSLINSSSLAFIAFINALVMKSVGFDVKYKIVVRGGINNTLIGFLYALHSLKRGIDTVYDAFQEALINDITYKIFASPIVFDYMYKRTMEAVEKGFYPRDVMNFLMIMKVYLVSSLPTFKAFKRLIDELDRMGDISYELEEVEENMKIISCTTVNGIRLCADEKRARKWFRSVTEEAKMFVDATTLRSRLLEIADALLRVERDAETRNKINRIIRLLSY